MPTDIGERQRVDRLLGHHAAAGYIATCLFPQISQSDIAVHIEY